LVFRLMRNITGAVSWQVAAVQIFETKGVKLGTGREWHRYSTVVILVLEVLKRQVLISYFVQGLLDWRNNVIWLQLCPSILANYHSLHLQTSVRKIPSVVLGYLGFVSSNQTEICLLFSLNR
jgi:hypothetical protein